VNGNRLKCLHPAVPHFLSSRNLFAALLLLGAPAASLDGQWLTGYYSAQNGVLPISAIPWSKYTHVIHFAASTPGDGTVSMYYLTQAEINTLISARPAGKKVLVCLKDNDSNYNAIPQSAAPGSIATFVNNIVNFVNSNGYDGVDIDWEKNINATQYQDLLSRLRSAMPTKVITIASNPGGKAVAAASQGVLDQVNVMCYDLDWGSSVSWYVDALLQNGNSNVLTCDWDVAQFTAAGVAAAKIGVGVPYYGRRWPGVTQPLKTSNFSKAITFFYRDLVKDATRWQPQNQVYDSAYKANYLSIASLNEFDSYTGTQFISDAVAWQKSKGFGGFMTFTLEYEYLAGQLGDAAYPLSTALYNGLYGSATAPAPPILTSATPVSSTEVDLAWTNPVNSTATANAVLRCTGLGCTPSSAIASISSAAASYKDTSVSASTTYMYAIRASNSTGATSSNSISATTPAPTAPAAPTLNSVTGVSPTEIDLAWTNHATNATGIRVLRCMGNPCTPSMVIATLPVSAVAYANTGLASATAYTYLVEAYNSGGNGNSNTMSGMTLSGSQAPAAPVLTLSNSGKPLIVLHWTENTSTAPVSSFDVLRCQGSGCTPSAVIASTLPASASSFTDSGLSRRTMYGYVIRANNGSGSTLSSTVYTATH